MDKKNKKGTGLRYNEGKLRYDLVQPEAHRDMVKVLTMGAAKYADRNWENGMNWSVVIQSLKRHLAAFEMGEDYDKESGELHMAHIACNVHFLNSYYYLYPQGDDRPKKWLNVPKIGLDIDEVLCDWIHEWVKLWNIKDVPTSWFFDRKIKERFKEMEDNNTLDEFYLNLPPLIKGSELPFEPFAYITSRPVSTEISQIWLDQHGFPSAPVYTVKTNETKVDVAKNLGVEVFVDDRYENFIELNDAGICCYLYDAPHNQKYNVGYKRIKSLNELPWFN